MVAIAMDISCESINALYAGGTELTKKMDSQLGLSNIIQSRGIKKKGLTLDKIALSLVSARIDKPDSVLKSVKFIRDESTAALEFRIEPEAIREKTYYRGFELLGKNAGRIYPLLMDEVHKTFGLDLNYLFMDWTSSFFNGGSCNLAKFGYSKDHRPDKKQVKIGLAMTAGKCIPFHFSVEAGNLVDTKQFRKDYRAIESRLPERALVIFDKGASSKENGELIRNSGRDYLTAIKNTAELRERLKQVDKSVMTKLFRYKSGERVFAWWQKRGDMYEYFYFDERKAKKDVETRERRIKKILAEKEELAAKIKNKGEKGLRRLTKRKRVTKELNDAIVTTEVTIQKRLINKTDEEIRADQEKERYLDGFFCLESSRKLSPKRALSLYRKKDKIEKLIADLKNVHRIRPFRVWTDNAVKGAVLICMIATLFVGLCQQAMGVVGKTKKTLLDRVRRLTLVVTRDAFGAIVSMRFANLTKFMEKFLNLSFG
jgi:transposase